MTELLDRAARFIDEGIYEGPQANNPTDASFHEISDGLGLVCGFSHVWGLRSGDGLTVFDTSLAAFGPSMVRGLRTWTDDAFRRIVYTHGHVDHVGGVRAFLADAESRGDERPTIVAHENAHARFERYTETEGYNVVINTRQFGSAGSGWGDGFVEADEVFTDAKTIQVGDTELQLRHDRGETDDHAWTWVPASKTIFCGDLFMWVFPNAGNPQKVQRYCADWAAALRKMIALEPELLAPAHGLPIAGKERIAMVLGHAAEALESLHVQTIDLMNVGATLDEIVHTVRVPDRLIDLPYLRPTYDEPEFVVRNIWRLYGGWYDGNPARLKPPPDASVAAEVAALAGGPDLLADRALAVASSGDLRLACQLAEWAGDAAPDDAGVHAKRADVYRQRRAAEVSLMAKGIFGSTADASDTVAATDA